MTGHRRGVSHSGSLLFMVVLVSAILVVHVGAITPPIPRYNLICDVTISYKTVQNETFEYELSFQNCAGYDIRKLEIKYFEGCEAGCYGVAHLKEELQPNRTYRLKMEVLGFPPYIDIQNAEMFYGEGDLLQIARDVYGQEVSAMRAEQMQKSFVALAVALAPLILAVLFVLIRRPPTTARFGIPDWRKIALFSLLLYVVIFYHELFFGFPIYGFPASIALIVAFLNWPIALAMLAGIYNPIVWLLDAIWLYALACIVFFIADKWKRLLAKISKSRAAPF